MSYRIRISFLLILFMAGQAMAELVVWHRSPLDFGNFRYVYDIEVLRLALDKTRTTHGDYQLQAIPAASYARVLHSLRNNTYPNMLLEISYDKQLEDSGELTYINFPIELGIIGYRVCFVNPLVKDKIKQAKTLADLLPHTVGQGADWADIDILRHNGFTVIQVSNYTSLFRMVAGGRYDLLCRGANELMMEYEQYKHISNLTYDESFALVYRMPRFFYLSKKNIALKQRVEEGLKIAYADGSLLALWSKHNLQSVRFTQLPMRKIFYLDNPLIKDLPKDYEQYFIDPMTLK
jgi:hypothetical protein